jgi:hypothetical protein
VVAQLARFAAAPRVHHAERCDRPTDQTKYKNETLV